MTDYQKEKCFEILEKYGFENQKIILAEECAELIQAVCKTRRSGEKVSDNFIEELADVEIMITQIKEGLSKDELIKFLEIENRKIERQLCRIKGIPARNCTKCVFYETCSKQKGEKGYCGNWTPKSRKRGLK